ncbi:hypothetical protein [Kocuria flava]|uniref:hypothetical protein n=1 Tax=Kocuria flava TaxID=446860 RepID=UPI0015DDAFC5|nr:hypothetical protein [Kocuria flava]
MPHSAPAGSATPSRRWSGAPSRHLREQLKAHGWDRDLIRQPVHDVDPARPTLF